MRSEKIAFITSEMGLTAEEAQAFWPVYNEIYGKRDEAIKNVFKTFKALNKALDEGSKGKEVSRLLDDYLAALETQRKVESAAGERYRKVLDDEKVAKLYVCEEKYRRQHIRRMHHKPGEPGQGRPGQPGQRHDGPQDR